MTLEQQITNLPCWKGALEIKPLGGGITNHNFLVSDLGERFVVRLGADIPEHQIMRFNELAASRAAHAAGLSPAVRYSGDGVLVMDYIDSQTLTAELIREDRMLQKVVDLVKQCHSRVPQHLRGASVVSWVFHIIRDYGATLVEGQSQYQEHLPEFLRIANQLETAAAPFDIVFSHNDLLAANILDDGERLWLIDWEYGGYNTPLFDLGGLASNNELDERQERWMLAYYFDRPLTDELWYRYQAMKCASLLRETLWSMVSEIHSTLDFDYTSYTAENLTRFERSYAAFQASA